MTNNNLRSSRSLKKNLQEIVNLNPGVRLLFFDESRFGTHSKLGHGWFELGSRTQVSISLGFKNFYVYSAVSSLDGFNFNLIMPNVDTACMNIYLSELSAELSHEKVILVLDGAGWHRSDALEVPNNIMLVYLPAYSPELNPTERLWAHMKYHLIRNKIYSSVASLELAVSDFILKLTNDLVDGICTCNYLDI